MDGLYSHINRFIFSDKPITAGLSSVKPANNCLVGPVFPLFFHKPHNPRGGGRFIFDTKMNKVKKQCA